MVLLVLLSFLEAIGCTLSLTCGADCGWDWEIPANIVFWVFGCRVSSQTIGKGSSLNPMVNILLDFAEAASLAILFRCLVIKISYLNAQPSGLHMLFVLCFTPGHNDNNTHYFTKSQTAECTCKTMFSPVL